jgi:predicted TIM-barrel fold metal-dependent hydrolase
VIPAPTSPEQGTTGLVPFVDTHFHLWDIGHERLRYDWLEQAHHPVLGSVRPLARSHLLHDYLDAVAGLDVAAAVHVQADASDPVRETEWLTALAERSGWPHAIVAFVDLSADDWADALARQSAFPRVRGIRDLRVGSLAGARRDWSDPQLVRALATLSTRGLHYELRTTHPEAAAVVRLLGRVDRTPVVLTHAGLPLDRSRDELRSWKRAMRQLASVDSLHCKVSGFGMGSHLSGRPWSTEDIRPLVLTCLELFGTTRTFFGSNWPVETLAVTYGSMLETYRTIVADCSADEQHDLLWRNAARFYRLPVTDSAEGARSSRA